MWEIEFDKIATKLIDGKQIIDINKYDDIKHFIGATLKKDRETVIETIRAEMYKYSEMGKEDLFYFDLLLKHLKGYKTSINTLTIKKW